jgi:hypothetical protein
MNLLLGCEITIGIWIKGTRKVRVEIQHISWGNKLLIGPTSSGLWGYITNEYTTRNMAFYDIPFLSYFYVIE